MKILAFGIGKFYQNKKRVLEDIAGNDEIIGFIDNRAKEILYYEDKAVLHPTEVESVDFDKILLMSVYYKSMREQLLELGINKNKIMFWEEYLSLKSHGKTQFYVRNDDFSNKKRILLITTRLDYNGGSIAATYAAKAIESLGYHVCIATYEYSEKFLDEVLSNNLNVIVARSLSYPSKEELFWIRNYDAVIVNTFQMIQSACKISQYLPTVWWLHEPSSQYVSIYDDIRYQYEEYDNLNAMRKIFICAVSERAKRNFEVYYPNRVDKILSYGISDEAKKRQATKNFDSKIVFAIIGGLVKLKAQDVFAEAVKLLPNEKKNKAEFWIIGASANDAYYKIVKRMAENTPQIKLKGLMSREEIREAYCQIDVVVCPSLDDSMPIVVTEGMMYEKICIISDKVGHTQYITDGVNGFICKAGDAKSLSEKIKVVIENFSALGNLRAAARQTYEKNFSMNSFADRLKEILDNNMTRKITR